MVGEGRGDRLLVGLLRRAGRGREQWGVVLLGEQRLAYMVGNVMRKIIITFLRVYYLNSIFFVLTKQFTSQ